MVRPAWSHRWPRIALLVIAAFAVPLASCAKGGGKKTMTLRLTSVPMANACGKPTGNSLSFRLLQVTDASALAGIPLDKAWDREDKVFGAALLSMKEGYIDPDTTLKIKYEFDPKTKAVIFVGAFCKPEGNCWYFVKPMTKSGTLSLTIDESCVRDTNKK